VSDSEPVLARIFERAALLSLSVPPQF